jgi:putative multiple sugar transport system ATP-binding protein
MSDMPKVLLEMKGITKQFTGIKALDDVNFTVFRNEIHALVGENGAGKSTLMNILSGLYPSGTYGGQIIYCDEECNFYNISDSERKGIVIIHQELALVPYLSIAENIFLNNKKFHKGKVINWARMNDDAEKMLVKVGLEKEDVTRPVGRLGIGKQQLIEIAKALAKDVNLLVLDEPTSALNDTESNLLLNLLLTLKQNEVTSILISHKLHEVCKIADSVTILRDGCSIETLTKPEEIRDENRIIRGMVGRDVAQRFPPRTSVLGDFLFEVKNWTVTHPDIPDKDVIKNVNFYVRKGEILGIAGLMGSGRTELALSLFGRFYGGNFRGIIKKDGREITPKNVNQAIKEKIAYMTEDRKTYGLVLFNDIKWNISLANMKKFSQYGIINKDIERNESEEASKKTRIKASSINQIVSNLSGGNQQKVVLSKWICAKPDLLILDEPTRGIDVLAKYEIYCIINELAEEGKGIVIISSDMTELLGMADRIYVLNEGQIAGEFARGEVSQEKIMKVIIEHSRRVS